MSLKNLEADLNAESVKQAYITQFEARINLLEKKAALQDKVDEMMGRIIENFKTNLDHACAALLKQQQMIKRTEKILVQLVQKLENSDDGGDWWKNG